MKKIFCAVLMMFVMCSVSFGASEDRSVYVRQDVFDAKMEILFTRLHSEIENLGTRLEGKIDALSERIDGLDKKIDGVEKSLSERINGVEKSLSERINGLDKKMDARFEGVEKRMDVMNKRIDDTHNFLYLILVLLGVMLAVPFINKYWDFHKEHRTPFATVEDVRRIVSEIIAENNAKIRA